MKKTKAPKCIICNKNLQRVTRSCWNEREPYKGNMICYRVKHKPASPDFLKYDTWSYTLWDGESYKYYMGRYRFCGVNCCAKYGIKHLPKSEKPKLIIEKFQRDIYPNTWFENQQVGEKNGNI